MPIESPSTSETSKVGEFSRKMKEILRKLKIGEGDVNELDSEYSILRHEMPDGLSLETHHEIDEISAILLDKAVEEDDAQKKKKI